MLKSRVITSVVLAALVLAALLLLPPIWLSVVLALMFLVAGGWENARLAGLSNAVLQAAWIGLLCVAGAGLIRAAHVPAAVPVIFSVATAGWLLLALWLRFPTLGRVESSRFQPTKLLVVAAILLAAFTSIAWMHAISPWLVIHLILIVAAADIGAYFAGHRFGGARLAPVISPGKTWAGVFGGLAAAMLVAPAASLVLPDVPLTPLVASLVAVPVVAYSICGDLLISLFKRHRGLKDTSTLLPGHGGMLDRVDGLSAAAPLFALILWAVVAGA
ncbi:MAG: phosphatidate cytidylyltransferase [Pseudomonadota bacterium]